ncbi:MAG TPA: non-canonical purine NTP pyrophosphatase [Methylomirabilota bacterium]|nr:non-canonical purine NTP pyrophosphatase [Methylomirabilota bacterium]
MTTIIIATRNAHKVEEIRSILGSQFVFLTLRDFPKARSVVEDANTFAGNATKKAVELAHWLSSEGSRFEVRGSRFVLADDSGLEVDALNGAPGVHSARFAALETGAAGNSADNANNAKLLRLLQNIPAEKRTARFRCVIALTPVVLSQHVNSSPVCAADEHELQSETFDGACEGQISFTPSGAKGFGYDPLFVPNGFTQSFAELGEDVKNRISHRAKALEKVRAALNALLHNPLK